MGLTRGLDGDLPGRGAVAFQGDAPDVAGEGVVAHSLSPLDYDYGFLISQQLIEINRMRGAGAFVQSIEVDVVEEQTAEIGIDEGE
jgi:hypothetical protein